MDKNTLIRDAMIPDIICRVRKVLEDELKSLMVDVKELEDHVEYVENQNDLLIKKVEELEIKNKDLAYKLKSKSSSSIWENMQVQLQEKDKQIEDIKKELDFYKRNYNVKNYDRSNASNVQIVPVEQIKSINPIDSTKLVDSDEEKPKKKKKSKLKKSSKGSKELDDLENELLNLS